MTASAPEPAAPREDGPATPAAGRQDNAPVSPVVLVAGMAVVVAAVLALASAGSWAGVAGIVLVLAAVIAVLVSWSDAW